MMWWLGDNLRMNDEDKRPTSDGALDDESLEQVVGGSDAPVHELTHTVQQGSRVGANQTITIGGSRTESVGGSEKP